MQMSWVDWVNPLQGGDSRGQFSTGGTYPAVGTPRGLTYWSPQTSDGPQVVDLSVRKIAGFRATHSASPWIADYGHFDVMPVIGGIGQNPEQRSSGCDLKRCYARPNELRAMLTRYGIFAELSATRACGVLRFTFPPDAGEHAAIVLQTGHGGSAFGGFARGEASIRGNEIVGCSMSNYGGVADNFGCHFVLQIEGADILGWGTLDEKQQHDKATESKGPRAGAYLRIKPKGPVVVRIATSFISQAQARLNLATEVGPKTYEQVVAATGAAWDGWLGKVELLGEASDSDRRTFHSCMYRAGLFPTAYHEFDEKGQPHYASPYNGRTQPGVMYTNNGFWDTYRTLYPLLAVVDPGGYGEILKGYLNAYRDGGWLPKWCAPGYREAMLGTHTDAIFADAIMQGIGGFDVKEAYEAIHHNAFAPAPGPLGRPKLSEYHKFGYYPADVLKNDSVSWTLDNAHCDWCVAQVALKLGEKADAEVLLERAKGYRHLFDPNVRFFRPKNSDGTWHGEFREFAWGGPYVEGGPWQERFHAPHDLPGLSELFGGQANLLSELKRMLEVEPRYEIGGYFGEIHEMVEMAVAVDGDGKHFGQYAHCNQPVHNYLFMGAALGDAGWASRQVARVMKWLYTPDTFPGDEDNGSMGAWYVLAALGRGPVCVGSGKTVEIEPWKYGAVRAKVKA